ncbi:DUF349 domain-containing protein [Neptunomonas japonica]|uniref:DUF349 domain-containing protein n=1 Tax=Neptunomonas japonica JAMM 1380 TaxID=1441457 RepID=A0A7R6PAK7_9GAMM|nr:DUF349 domain-containing protein [Neptunomonas japonica]BBB28944.1 conserved hypothetical protein [Neptunomonas japonica JAMM 1380]
MLSNFFKPKWQHTNPVIRLNAVKSLSDESNDQYLILSGLAIRDPDVNVRQAAIAQIMSINNLIQLLKDPDANSSAIETRLAHELSNDSNPHALFEQLSSKLETTVMWRIISQTPSQELHATLINNIKDQSLLVEVATSSSPVHTRKIAAERISTPALLEQLLKATKQNDKAIYRIMRDKCNELREHTKQQQALRDRAMSIFEQVTSLSKGEWFPLYPAKFEALSQEWNNFSPSVTQEFQQPFSDAYDTCQKRIQTIAAQEAEKAQELLNMKLAREKADTILQQLQDFTTCAEATSYSQQDEIAALTKAQESFQHQWASISNTASANQLKTYNQLTQALSKIHSHALSADSKLNAVSEFLSSCEQNSFKKKTVQEQLKQANSILEQTAWPKNLERPDVLQQLDSAITKLTSEKQLLTQKSLKITEKLRLQLAQLERLIEKGEVKTAEKESRKTIELLSQIKGTAKDNFEQQYKGLNTRIEELKDWQGYAVTPKKEQLCADMEGLINAEILPQEKAKKIKQLQQQWKLLDATDPFHSQAIWKRFKTASDKAYEPCEVYFSSQNESRRYNLQQKELIYQEVAAYLQQIDWQAGDWRAVEQIIQAAKQEWRRFTPVDRNPGQALQTKFNKLLLDAENHFQALKEDSMAAKEKLIADAQALTTADDIVDAAEQAKKLQKNWKECGPTFHSQERKLWKAFRVHCDIIFQRLHDQTPSREAAYAAKVTLNQVTDELAGFEDAPLHTAQKIESITAARQLVEAFKESLTAKDIERFNKAANYVEQQTNALQRFAEHTDNHQLQEHSALCDLLETHLLDNSATESKQDFFEHWHLQKNTDLHEKIRNRRSLIESIASGESELEPLLSNADKELREICIRLEIALNLPSPSYDQALRMEYQMQRLQKALEQQQQAVNLIDIKKLEFESLGIPFRKANESLNERFQDLINTVFN